MPVWDGLLRVWKQTVLLRNQVTENRHFGCSLGCLSAPVVGELATQLASLDGLSVSERDVIVAATRENIHAVLHGKLSRLLVLELNGARVTGRLKGETSEQRWNYFLDLSSKRSFWDELGVHYPTALSRVDTILRNRCAAATRFAKRWVSDRARLAGLCGSDLGELQGVSFGAGDSHCQGATVALLRGDSWRVVYKPRSLAIDVALGNFAAELTDEHGSGLYFRIPKIVEGAGYGWMEFVNHRYANGHEELVNFYRGIGNCLAVMRLIGGTDLHAENLIAEGSTPVLVDCETLFTPRAAVLPTKYGIAHDRALDLISGTALNVGLLPGRGMGLGWRGIDPSALGMIPGQQPIQKQQVIVRAGFDDARVSTILVEPPKSQNHPSPDPALAEYWPEVLRGFDELTTSLRRLDSEGILATRLRRFEQCTVRMVTRPTEVYAELTAMLWHPASLHNPQPARQGATELLTKMAENVRLAPNDPVVIEAEIEELLEGDIPYFSGVVREGTFSGPRGTQWLPQSNLTEATLKNWRAADFILERSVIQASLVSAYINDGWTSGGPTGFAKQARGGDLDKRRRRQAAEIVRRIMNDAIRGEDGTVAWIAPVLSPTGWAVQPLDVDLYNGISGVAVLLGAYLHEAAAGHADPVDGVDQLFAATLRTLERAEQMYERGLRAGVKKRPAPPGAYIGLGSQIWAYLILSHWHSNGDDGLERACKLAEQIPEATEIDERNELLCGTAGAIAPLLMLSRRTGDQSYTRVASQLGDLLQERATYQNGKACWKEETFAPEGLGGFAHGVTGIGWALAHLARATGNTKYRELAQKAFAFEDSLFDEGDQNWRDLRGLEGPKTAAAWCHGSVGIGLAHLNLDPKLSQPKTRRLLRQASSATWRIGMGRNQCPCHGNLGAWELLRCATAAGEAPEDLDESHLLDVILTSLEQDGPSSGLGGNVFPPGLLPGAGGIAYQLLRAHPKHNLPSILTPGEEELSALESFPAVVEQCPN